MIVWPSLKILATNLDTSHRHIFTLANYGNKSRDHGQMIEISTKRTKFYRVSTLSNRLLYGSPTPKRYTHCWIAPTKWYSCTRRCCSSHTTKYHSIERRDQHSKRCKLSSRSIERANIRHSIGGACMWLSALLNPMQIRANRNNSMFNVIHITRHFFLLDVFFISCAGSHSFFNTNGACLHMSQ